MVILVRAPRIQPTYLRVAQSWEILEEPRAPPCSGGHAHNPHAQVAVFFACHAHDSPVDARAHGSVLRRPRTPPTHPCHPSRPGGAPRIAGLHREG